MQGSDSLTRIIHKRFCCNRGDGSQNPMRYSLFAPRSRNGRSTSQARWRRTWTRSARRPGRRARCSGGQHTVSSMPPSLAGSALEPASPTLTRGPSPLVESPRRGHTPFGTPRRGCSPPRGSARLSRLATARFRDEPS
jgi:hypothetical protein